MIMKLAPSLTAGVLLISLALPLAPTYAATSGASCPKAGATQTTGGKKFTCVKSGKKLVWNKGVKVSTLLPSPLPITSPSASPSPSPSSSLVPTQILQPAEIKFQLEMDPSGPKLYPADNEHQKSILIPVKVSPAPINLKCRLVATGNPDNTGILTYSDRDTGFSEWISQFEPYAAKYIELTRNGIRPFYSIITIQLSCEVPVSTSPLASQSYDFSSTLSVTLIDPGTTTQDYLKINRGSYCFPEDAKASDKKGAGLVCKHSNSNQALTWISAS